VFCVNRARICLVTALCLLLMCLPVIRPAEAAAPADYGYSLLTSDTQRNAYKVIEQGIAGLTPKITVSVQGITSSNYKSYLPDIQKALDMVLKDHPEFFWYPSETSYSITTGKVIIEPKGYSVGGQSVSAGSAALQTAQSKLDSAVNKILAKLPNNPSDYEIAHTIHDYIVNNVDYVHSGDHQTAYGALVLGKAVCAGYARAYQLVMNKAGIRCTYIAGQSYDPAGNLVNHAWNLYWLDGKCYYSDVTWDDQDSGIFHEYLNMSKEEISKTHFTGESLPAVCGHGDYTFFIKNAGNGVCDIKDHKDAKDVAKCFEIKSQNGKNVEFYCTIHYHKNDFKNWLSGNIRTIAEELNLIGQFTYSQIELGMEHHVTIKGTLASAPADPTKPTDPVKPTEPTPTTAPTTPATPITPTTPRPTTPATPTTPSGPTVGDDPTVPIQPTQPDTADPTRPTAGTVAPTEPPAGGIEPSTPATVPGTQLPTDPANEATTPSAKPGDPTTGDQDPTMPAGTQPNDATHPNGTGTGPVPGSSNSIMVIAIAVGGIAVLAAIITIILGFRRKKD